MLGKPFREGGYERRWIGKIGKMNTSDRQCRLYACRRVSLRGIRYDAYGPDMPLCTL